jgi:hypothetical protein
MFLVSSVNAYALRSHAEASRRNTGHSLELLPNSQCRLVSNDRASVHEVEFAGTTDRLDAVRNALSSERQGVT